MMVVIKFYDYGHILWPFRSQRFNSINILLINIQNMFFLNKYDIKQIVQLEPVLLRLFNQCLFRFFMLINLQTATAIIEGWTDV